MSSASGSKDKKPAGGRPTIHTLSDLNRRSRSESDSDSDEPQEYYTGGEKSGMLVQDPSKDDSHADALFDEARKMAVKQGMDHHPSSSSRSFTGTGRILSGETVPSSLPQPESIYHNVYLWRDGFTVNGGPLRRFDDPGNESFMESLKKSECPKELEPDNGRSTVHVNLVRKYEKCPEPVKRICAFQGVGRTLGGCSSGGQAPETASVTEAPSSAPSPHGGLYVDDSLPTTSIQLRLADGTRMVARFNIIHTVGDIHSFIDASRPGTRTYQLQAVGFPPKELSDMTQTIEQAGLANSVVIQKL